MRPRHQGRFVKLNSSEKDAFQAAVVASVGADGDALKKIKAHVKRRHRRRQLKIDEDYDPDDLSS
jgi:hypothetical protein